MSVESTIYAALKDLVSGRVYRDIVKHGDEQLLPRITFQQVGGRPVNYLEGGKPSKKNARIQINSWHTRRDDAMALGRLVADTMRATATLAPTVLTEMVASHEPGVGPNGADLYGAHQDFSVWFDD